MVRPLGECTLQGGHGRSVVLTDEQHDVVGADARGREEGAVDDEVGAALHEQAVLEAERLALGSVGEEHGASTATSGDRPPLGSDRERRTPATAQIAPLEDLDQPGPAARRGSEPGDVGGAGLHAGRGRWPCQ
jgi:hypothetical protein